MNARRFVLTGGGTGGHITPLLAVAHQLKRKDPTCHIIYIGERKGKYASLTAKNKDIDEIHSIFAGKFRRYHGESWLRRLLAVRTNLLNLRDLIYFGIGTVQSFFLVRKLKPDMILLKGGFVGVPVGLAAAFWKLRFITHDSDALPGLANRIVSRWALLHATGMPPEYYRYPRESMRYVGVLVGPQYVPVTDSAQEEYKRELGLPESAQVLTVTGGSGGAAAINKAVRAIVAGLLDANPDLFIFHQVGLGKGGIYDDYEHDRLRVVELLNPMYTYTGASDVVVTRAGANTMAELGVQGRACIVVPNPLLTGGHQLKNAELWRAEKAAVIIEENVIRNDPDVLREHVQELLDDPKVREQLGGQLSRLTVKDAAAALADLMLESDFTDAQAQ